MTDKRIEFNLAPMPGTESHCELESGKESVLEEAIRITGGNRRSDYGSPADNFVRWRDLCRASGRPSLATITAEDLCHVMILGKVARDTNSPKRDNAVDIAGYAYVLDECRGL